MNSYNKKELNKDLSILFKLINEICHKIILKLLWQKLIQVLIVNLEGEIYLQIILPHNLGQLLKNIKKIILKNMVKKNNAL